MPKLSEETLRKRLNCALEMLDKERRINRISWEEKHKLEEKVMRLEEENKDLRIALLKME